MLNSIPLRPQIQTLQMQARSLQLKEQQRVAEYQEAATRGQEVKGDMVAMLPALKSAMADRGDRNVSADGVKMNTEFSEARARMTTNRGRVDFSVQDGAYDTKAFIQLRNHAEQLRNIPGLPPAVQAALNSAFDGVAEANLRHQSGNRYMSWASARAPLAERELEGTTNLLRAVMSDHGSGKNVASEAIQINKFYTAANIQLDKYNEFLGAAAPDGQRAIVTLGAAIAAFDQALEQLP